MISQDQKIYLSPSALNLFQECPLCFWLQEVKKIYRPRGPFPSLPGGMDLLIKKYFDKYRAQGKLPPELVGKVRGKLISDQNILNQWRSTYKNSQPQYFDQESKAVLFGGLDECLVDDDYYIPVDYKTRGFNLKENTVTYYQTQLDCYTLLLEASGLKHFSFGYLIFYIPEIVEEYGKVKFKIDVQKISTEPKRAIKIFQEAVKLLRGSEPKSHSQCQFCSWGNDFLNFR